MVLDLEALAVDAPRPTLSRGRRTSWSAPPLGPALVALVLVLAVDRKEPGIGDDRARRHERRRGPGGGDRRSRPAVGASIRARAVVPVASFICEATVRCQTSS